jgi:serine/threonine protein phosphatase PrpC
VSDASDPLTRRTRGLPEVDGTLLEGADLPPCPECGEPPVDSSARFCEACGATLPFAAHPVSSTDFDFGTGADGASASESSFGSCAHCGGAVGDDRYCTSCGLRAMEAVTVEDRGSFAYATHRGRRHPRNEDAGALATTSEGWPILVVSDGVSASPNPHLASAAAVTTVVHELDYRPFTGPDDLIRAIAAAHQAACDVPADGDPQWVSDGTRPACTIVVAVAAGETVHVANVGDARAYLLAAATSWTATQLSTDDSLAALVVQEGGDPTEVLSLPGGHAITAWLGGDAPAPAVHLATHPATPGDVLLACSDGLWNYAPTDESLAEQVNATLPPPAGLPRTAAKVCKELVSWAIDQGGSDNICVAIAPVASQPPDGPKTPDDGSGETHRTDQEDEAS